MKDFHKKIFLYGGLLFSILFLGGIIGFSYYFEKKEELVSKISFYEKNFSKLFLLSTSNEDLETLKIKYTDETALLSSSFFVLDESNRYELGQKTKKQLELLGLTIDRYRSVAEGENPYCDFSVKGSISSVLRFFYQTSASPILVEISNYQLRMLDSNNASFSFRIAYAKK